MFQLDQKKNRDAAMRVSRAASTSVNSPGSTSELCPKVNNHKKDEIEITMIESNKKIHKDCL